MALRGGPKPEITRPLPPPLPDAVDWIEMATGQPLYPWQREVLADLEPTTPRPRVAYVQVPRKNGKTRLAAMLALLEACSLPQRHIYAISDSERNLNSVLMREIRDLIYGSEHLIDSLHIYQNKIEVPDTKSFIEARPNNFKASQGINPHLVLFDEVHLQRNEDIWNGMQMAGAARPDALLFGITTPGYDLAGLAHTLYQSVRAGDPTLYGRIYEGIGEDIDNRAIWRQANPIYDRPGFAEVLEFDRERLPEHEFRRYRLGQWTATESAWLPYGAWAALADPRRGTPEDGARVWLGFDGSYSGDSTALVGVTEDGYVFVVGAWENPGRKGWRVPRDDVDAAVHEAMNRWNVAELLCDPPYWQAEIARWAALWPRQVVEFPTHVRARMAPACTAFHAAVMEGKISHDGDPRLARHISNAIVKSSPQGDYITKPDPMSPAKIDLAVAAVVAYSRASVNVRRTRPKVVVL